MTISFYGPGGKVEKESFYEWMIRSYCKEEPEDEGNDIKLAEDIKFDAEFPKTESWFGIRRYLSLCGAGYDVLHTFDD